MQGEFLGVGSVFGSYYLGARGGGEPGDGAFLGKPVRGFEQVGQVLADSDLFYSCAATRAFSAVYGRPLTIYDAEAIKPVLQSFKTKRDFNQLIRDLVTLDAFSKEN